MSFLNKEDKWFLDSIREELVSAEEDKEIMEYALFDVYSHQLNKDLEYYSEAPAMLKHCFAIVLEDLHVMEQDYLATEEYEKCEVVLRVKNQLIEKFNIKVKPITQS